MTDMSPAVIRQLARIDRDHKAEHFPEMRRLLIEERQREIDRTLDKGGCNREQ